jgi:hypothetical protein
MGNLAPGNSFDPSQFRLQPDGTFRISIRATAALAGIDFSSLARSLRSASATGVDEIALPCARSLLAEGFDPVAVSTWGEMGGIPEDGLVCVLKHYGFNAASPSRQAADALLAFAAVGINAYLKEQLGLFQSQPAPATPAPRLSERETLVLVNEAIDTFERLGGVDERDQLLFKDITRNVLLKADQGLLPGAPRDEELTLSDAWLEVYKVPLPRENYRAAGVLVADAYRRDFKAEPPTRTQFVDGAPRQVKSYRRNWLLDTLKKFQARLDPST